MVWYLCPVFGEQVTTTNMYLAKTSQNSVLHRVKPCYLRLDSGSVTSHKHPVRRAPTLFSLDFFLFVLLSSLILKWILQSTFFLERSRATLKCLHLSWKGKKWPDFLSHINTSIAALTQHPREVSHKSTPLASNLPVLYRKRGRSCCLAITCLIKANRSNKQQDAVKLCILPWGLKHCFCEWCMGTKHCDWIVELKFNKEMIITVYMNNCIFCRGFRTSFATDQH